MKKILGGEENQHIRNMACSAYGCGLAGSISHTTDGTGFFYCRFHFGLKPSQNDKVTGQIHQNKELRTLYDICTSPEKFFQGTKQETVFSLADKDLGARLGKLKLTDLYFSKNLLKTKAKILAELDKRTTPII